MIINEQLARDAVDRKGSFPRNVNPFSRSVALWRAAAGGGARVEVRAAYLHELVKLAAIEIEPGWVLAGNHLPTERHGLKLPNPSSPDDVRLMAGLGVREEEFASIAEAVGGWDEWPAAPHDNVDPEDRIGAGPWGDVGPDRVFIGGGWVENHSIRDYEKLIRVGFNAVREEIETEISRADTDAADYADKHSFWLAALAICDAGVLLGERYARHAADLAEQADSQEDRQRFERMAEACRRVPADGARTLAEAVQSLLLLHILTCGEDGINANSLGRLDQILYPYYAADLEAGRLDRTGALALMEELACKLYLEYDVQHITLGGVDADGNCAVNELSTIILEATENVEFVRCISVRLGMSSPPEFVQLSCELMARGGGIPFVFNDDCFIPALTERGISLVDARNYAPIGCIELTVPGRANPHAASGWFNSLKCLELALFGGCDPQTGRQLGPDTGTLEDFDSFEDVFSAYSRQVETFAQRMVNCCNRGEIAQQAGGPLPCWSVMTDDCIKRGRDITDGGAVYNYHSVCFLGTANTADALMAIKRLVFEQKLISPADMLAALRANFEGFEPLRQMILNDAPKYGNDIPEVDALARPILRAPVLVHDERPLRPRRRRNARRPTPRGAAGLLAIAPPGPRCRGRHSRPELPRPPSPPPRRRRNRRHHRYQPRPDLRPGRGRSPDPTHPNRDCHGHRPTAMERDHGGAIEAGPGRPRDLRQHSRPRGGLLANVQARPRRPPGPHHRSHQA
jgi:formate C-acetyltransferase